MSNVALIARQFRFDNKAFWRNPPAAFFTFVFPLMFLFILNVLFGDDPLPIPGGQVDPSTYYIPAIVCLSVVTACFVNIAITVSFSRDQGLLKRARGTPLPPWIFLTSRIAHGTFIAVLLVTIVTALGAVAYGVDVPEEPFAAFVVTVVVGAAAFSALGLAMTAAIPNADAGPPMVNGIVLPLYFFSGVFVPFDADTPEWIKTVGGLFPIKHFVDALMVTFSPFTRGTGYSWDDLGVMVLWGAFGVFAAVRYFTWEPRR